MGSFLAFYQRSDSFKLKTFDSYKYLISCCFPARSSLIKSCWSLCRAFILRLTRATTARASAWQRFRINPPLLRSYWPSTKSLAVIGFQPLRHRRIKSYKIRAVEVLGTPSGALWGANYIFKMAKPRVFFDIACDGKPTGRIVMEVTSASMIYINGTRATSLNYALKRVCCLSAASGRCGTKDCRQVPFNAEKFFILARIMPPH